VVILDERLRNEIRANRIPYCIYKEECRFKLAGRNSGKHIRCGMYQGISDLCSQQRWDLEYEPRGNRTGKTRVEVDK